MSSAEGHMSSVSIITAFNDIFNRHDVDGMMAMMTDDTVFENTDPPPDGVRYEGQAAVRAFWADFFRAAPKARIEIEEIFGDGDRCVMRWTYHWADDAGKPGHVRGVDIFRLRGGKIAEKLSYVKG